MIERLQGYCNERGKDLLQLAFAWLLAQPVISSVVAGATSAEQLEKNLAASAWQLSDHELAAIDALLPASA